MGDTQSERNIKENILKNLHYLSEDLCNFPVLVNLLLQENILERNESDEINIKQTSYDRATILWTILVKKGDILWKLTDCLRKSGNVAVEKKLLAINSKIISEENFKIWFNDRRSSKNFQGRIKELLSIEKYWDSCYQLKRHVFVVITGLGGTGKTEIARRFAENFHEYVKGHVIWIDSASTQSIQNSFEDLAKNKMSISLTDTLQTEKSLSSLVKEIYEKLLGTKCLIVLDNIESYDKDILKILHNVIENQSPSIIKPFVLITSRYNPVKGALGHAAEHLTIDVLPEDDAKEYVAHCLGIDKQNENNLAKVAKICKELNNLPFALSQAVAYIQQETNANISQTLDHYLEKLAKETKQILNHPIAGLDDTLNTTYMTWNTTFQKISSMPLKGPDAVSVIKILSFFSPDKISQQFVMDILENSNGSEKHAYSEAIKLLCDYSMCSSQDGELQIHRLVQCVVQIGLADNNSWDATLQYLLFNLNSLLIEKRVKVTQLVHIISVWEHAVQRQKLPVEYENLQYEIFMAYHEAGRYNEALEFCTAALHLFAAVSYDECRMTLKMMHLKGCILEDLGKYDDALNIQLDTFEKQSKIFGIEDEDCILTSGEVGLLYYRKKDFVQATKLLREVIRIREKTPMAYKDNQRRLLGLKNNLALVYAEENKSLEALQIYDEVYLLKEELLGKDHPGTLITMHNIGTVKYDLKQFAEALKIFQDVLEARNRQSMDIYNPETLKTKCWIAKTHACLKNYAESKRFANEALKGYRYLNMENHENAKETEKLVRDLLAKTEKKNKKKHQCFQFECLTDS